MVSWAQLTRRRYARETPAAPHRRRPLGRKDEAARPQAKPNTHNTIVAFPCTAHITQSVHFLATARCVHCLGKHGARSSTHIPRALPGSSTVAITRVALRHSMAGKFSPCVAFGGPPTARAPGQAPGGWCGNRTATLPHADRPCTPPTHLLHRQRGRAGKSSPCRCRSRFNFRARPSGFVWATP